MKHHSSCQGIVWISRTVGSLMAFTFLLGAGMDGKSPFGWGADQAIAQEACYMVTSSGQRVSLGALCGETPPEAKSPISSTGAKKDGIVRIKIKRRLASTPVIDVAFNGQAYEMIFDTGASSTLITSRMANALKLRPTGYRNVIIADGSTVTFPVSSIQTVAVGGVTAKNLEVTVADKADIGLLGHDFFGKYDVKIRRTVVELHPPSGQ
ncbi:MAG: retropepsin-like aspartic protease [Synechococcales bacterium]|nr:retropepsin-like aspartic protease [Synechococcales bacterium]